MKRSQKIFRAQRTAGVIALGLICALAAAGQTTATSPQTPPPSGEIYPLSQVHAGLRATAWTVFRGTRPEPMEVEILGILRGGRGPGQDMILAQLHGAKPEYTGVVAGMSGSPVYVNGRLMGALAYRIGQFSKDPIAGITPIEQMLTVRDLPASSEKTEPAQKIESGGMNLQPMETPLAMSGFGAEAIRFWRERMAGTGLEMVAAGGEESGKGGMENGAKILPGEAVSALLVRGDMEIAATCTVTYSDAQRLLACGHPLLQAGRVSLPMTASEVVTTLASPMNAFKIVNTGREIGAFSEDRSAAIRGELGRKAQMIPLQITVHSSEEAQRRVKVEILDQPGLTPLAAMVVLLQSLNSALSNTAEASYHVQGTIKLHGINAFPVDIWATPTQQMSSQIAASLQLGLQLNRIYSSGARQEALESIELTAETLPRQAQIELTEARLLGSNQRHAGDRVEVEATLHPWQQPEQKIRLEFRLPARLREGTVRLLVSDGGTLDRASGMHQSLNQNVDLHSLLAESRQQHPADRLYASLLVGDAEASLDGQALSNLPLSMVNALEAQRANLQASLHGESIETLVELPVNGPLTGFSFVSLHIVPGGGLD